MQSLKTTLYSTMKYEYAVLVIALVWALFFSFVLQFPPGFSEVGDDGSYLLAAKNLYLKGQLDESRPIVIAAIHGFPLLFGFSDPVVIAWCNVISISCWFLTSILLFKLIAQKFPRRIAFIAAVTFISCIGNLTNAFNVLAEAIFIFLVVLAVFFIGKQVQTKHYKYTTLAFSILLLAILVKPLAFGLVGIVALCHFKNYKAIIGNSFVVFILFSLSLIGIQLHSMKKQYGDYTVSYVDVVTYYNYLGGKADCLKKGIDFVPGENDRAKKFSQFSSHEQKKIASSDLNDQLLNNTSNFMQAYAFCLYSNSSKGSYSVSECKNEASTFYFDFFYFSFKAISKVQNILFTITGVLLSFYYLFYRKKVGTFYKIIALFISYIFFISGMSCLQCDRFHILFFPLVIVLGISLFVENRQLVWKQKPI
jgi:hypothetical protein